MIWIIGIIGFFVVVFLFKFASATSADTNYVKDNGGMRVMYSTLIQGIKEDKSTPRVREHSLNSVVIDGEFLSLSNAKCVGRWVLNIQHTFKILQVSYKGSFEIEGEVINIDKKWDFPINYDQKKMVDIIRGEMDKVVLCGVVQ